MIERTLAKRREDRYSGMTEFTHALRDVFVGSETLRRVLQAQRQRVELLGALILALE